MRTFAKVCNITAIVFLTIATVIQGFAVHAVGKSNVTALTENRWLMPVWIAALVLLPVALVLGMLFKKKERINLLPLLLAAVGTLFSLLVALALWNALPSQVNLNSINQTQGLTVWRLIYRHLSSAAAGVLVMVACHLNGKASRDERIQHENDMYKEHYDLSGKVLFKDEESTIGLNQYGEDFGEKKPARRLKRSQRVAQRKGE